MLENRPLFNPSQCQHCDIPVHLKSLVDECKLAKLFCLRSNVSHFFGSIISCIGICIAKLMRFEGCR